MFKISVIIPIYNVENYLETAVESVLKQNHTNCQIILVDDESPDSSGEIADRIKKENPDRDIIVIHQKNRGLGGARNAGIDAATGEYLLFLDSDDSLADGAIEKLAVFAEEKDCDIVVFDYLYKDENGKTLSYANGCDGSFSEATLSERKELLFMPNAAWNKLVRKRLFTDNKIYFAEKLWFEDLATMPKLYPDSKIGYINEPFYLYLQRSGSIMKSGKSERNLEIITAAEEILRFYKERNLFDRYYEELEYLVFFHVYFLSSSRVLRGKGSKAVLGELKAFVKKTFPDYAKNKYISKKERFMATCFDKNLYFIANAIFTAKAVINKISK